MTRYQKLVEEFHVAMGLPIGSYFAPKVDNPALRTRLVDEETRETIEALEARDLVGVLDGLGDTVYVATGTAVQYGLVLDFPDRPKISPKVRLIYPLTLITWMNELRKEVLEALLCESCLPKAKFMLERLCTDCIQMASDCGVDLWPVFQEIHRSNCSKVGAARRADGKLLKGDQLRPPKIRELLLELGWQP